MAFRKRLTVRFDDVDFARIVYFPNLFGYCHQAFEDFFAEEVGVPYARMLQERRVGYPAVHAESDFKAPLRFGDPVEIVMETLRVGKRSITCRYRLLHAETGELCSEITLVTTAISMDRHESVEVPEDVKAAFLRHQAQS